MKYSKELKHANHKYIKREKKNGKWVYYYDNGEGHSLNEMADRAARGDFGNGAQRKQMLGDAYNAVQKRVNRNYENVDYDAKDAELKKAQKESKSVGKYAKSTVQRGANAAMKILNNIGDGTIDNKVKKASKKAADWLSKIFGRK